MAASVEDFPDPVGPVTRTMPFRRSTISCKTSGRFSSANPGVFSPCFSPREMSRRARYDVAFYGSFLKGRESAVGSHRHQSVRRVSVVIPCLHDANPRGFCVAEAVNAFRASGLSGEVILADNGSSGGSIQIAEEHGARRHRRCRRPTHHGRCGP